MKFNGLIGQAYSLPDVTIDCQRMVNLYIEAIESGMGKDEAVAYLRGTPGLEKLFEIGSGECRLLHFDGLSKDDGAYFQKDRLFMVSGSELIRFSYDPVSGWDYVVFTGLNTSSGPVSAASADIDYGVTVFVDGSDDNYVYHKTTTTAEAFTTFAAHAGTAFTSVERATQVEWVDGYFVFIVQDTNEYHVSEWNSLDVSALSFAAAEGNADSIVAIISNQRDLWLLNKRTVEIHANTGNSDFPFERVQGGFIENGCLAPFSVAKISGTVLWLGRDASGQGIINAAGGPQHVRVSTNAIERAISSYESPEDATAYTYQDAGHQFYVISFAEATWVYDLTTKMWHERASFSDGAFGRQRAQCHAFFPPLGIHLVGDFENGKLYKYNDDKHTDDGAVKKWLRSTPHIQKGRKWIFHNKLELDIETGVGLDGASTIQGHDPQVMMRFSDDGGHVWSNEKWASLGKLGQRLARVIWRRLGKSRDRVYEISGTDPVKIRIMGAELDIELASN
jgi:hypothetical protein